MGDYGRDPDTIRRDLVIVRWHPRFEGVPILDALRELKAQRRA